MGALDRTNVRLFLEVVIIAAMAAIIASAGWGQPRSFDENALRDAFEGAQRVDLSKSAVSSVVKLRDVVKIVPPEEIILVKTFDKQNMPEVLKPAFAKPGTMGVTIMGRYVAILSTEFEKEYNDILAHELVHAYITLVSPKPLPFWFQEGSAVHFSTDKEMKFYGKPDDKKIGVMVGKTVDLDPAYKQKLKSFQYMKEKAGDEKFNEWFKNAVETGNVDARGLLGISAEARSNKAERKAIPGWVVSVVVMALVVVTIVGIVAMKRERDLW